MQMHSVQIAYLVEEDFCMFPHKTIVFEDYEAYRKFILESRKKKDQRDKKFFEKIEKGC